MWRVRWREGDRRRVATFARQDLAERFLAMTVGQLAQGKAGLADDRRDALTIAEHAESWTDRRYRTHRSARNDEQRMRDHVLPAVGHHAPHELTQGHVRGMVEALLSKKVPTRGGPATPLASGSVRKCVALLSTFMTEMVEKGHAAANPCLRLPKSVRRLTKPTHNPRDTPFLPTPDKLREVFHAMPRPYAIATAVGGLCGLRTGETMGLRWVDVADIETGRVYVRQQRHGRVFARLKDDEGRITRAQAALAPLLRAWRAEIPPSAELVCVHQDGTPIGEHRWGRYLAAACTTAGIPRLTVSQATRHFYASMWMIFGGSLGVLREHLGHSSVTTTERYAHLNPALYPASDAERIRVDLLSPKETAN